MANGRNTQEIKRIRNEILMALKMMYPAALQANRLMRSLLILFPTLDFDYFKRDLHYLVGKKYIERVTADSESDKSLTPWRKRWFRLSVSGLEVIDHCIRDPALEE